MLEDIALSSRPCAASLHEAKSRDSRRTLTRETLGAFEFHRLVSASVQLGARWTTRPNPLRSLQSLFLSLPADLIERGPVAVWLWKAVFDRLGFALLSCFVQFAPICTDVLERFYHRRALLLDDFLVVLSPCIASFRVHRGRARGQGRLRLLSLYVVRSVALVLRQGLVR